MKIVTFNIMAQRFYDQQLFSWPARLARIIELLSSLSADIICLQEVEIQTFKEDFGRLFDEYDFHGHDITKKRNSPIGNYTLWKKSLSTIGRTNTSSSIIVQFDIAGKIICLANVHLKAGINNVESINTRRRQMKSVLLAKPDIICGDFNDNFTHTDMELMLYEEYQPNNRSNTCCVEYKGSYSYWNFDNIVTKNDLAGQVNEVKLFAAIDDKIIPNDEIPSDHVPVIAEINF